MQGRRVVDTNGRALVLGGGIAGLAAALVLRRHFERVTLIERDEFSPRPGLRRFAPHGAHSHVLLAKGLQVLQSLVPDLDSRLEELHVPLNDLTEHVRFCYGGTWMRRFRSGIPFRPCSRAIVEHVLLEELRRHPNVELRTGHNVTGFIGRDPIEGAVIEGEKGEPEEVFADWTVVAMGRGNGVLHQLEEVLGQAVEEEVVDPGVTYTSGVFRVPPSHPQGWSVMADVSRYPAQPEMAIIVRSSPREWTVSHVGYGRSPTPKDPNQLIARFAGMSTGVLAEELREAWPLTELRSYGNTANRRRRFGEIRRWPRRMVVMGDTACSLNPRHAQGMTLSMAGAELLHEMLGVEGTSTAGLDDLAGRFQRALDKRYLVPWQLALMEDRLWAAKFAGRSLGTWERLAMMGTRRALDTAFTDADTYRRFMAVAHLISTPLKLVNPLTVAKIALPGLRRAG